MKKLSRLMLSLSLAGLVFILLLLVWQFIPNSLLGPLMVSRSSVITVASELQDMSLLNTSEYKMRLRFPYDFAQGKPDWTLYKNTWDFNQELFSKKIDPANYPDGQVPELWQSGEFYLQCRSIGVDPFDFRYDFLVLSVILKGGVDLSRIVEIQGLYGPGMDQKNDSHNITLPGAEITEFIIEDMDMTQQGYPDAPISPEELRYLVELLSPRIEQLAMDAGLLEDADLQAQQLMNRILTVAGNNQITLNQP
ncbi:MAG: DUF4230 domain-containing protein [Spirochaetaceae bacterium]|jgi:hypothetical protein|nr:DUF4230 domain-containing protein [Spirochaetaceae bacterium]